LAGDVSLATADTLAVYAKVAFVPLAKPEMWMAQGDQ
jgi:hypothetical protein